MVVGTTDVSVTLQREPPGNSRYASNDAHERHCLSSAVQGEKEQNAQDIISVKHAPNHATEDCLIHIVVLVRLAKTVQKKDEAKILTL